ncbi:hypothetical protein [uncultured Muribaculum sp.]|uniref:hypothetical protein n=1 Tax=uncultured Muribaculum sp. TaxID=1918613 RepID=UPI0025DF2B26|nr:hypothetical protein [uncultured Muribaculum sp.]
MKKFLLLGASALLTLPSGAQTDYHGFSIDASQALIDNPFNQALGEPWYRNNKQISLQAFYQPEYSTLTVNEELTEWEHGTTTHTDAKGKFGDLTSNATSHKGTQNYHVDLALKEGLVNGAVLKAEMSDNGLCYVTVPEQYYVNNELVDVPPTGGDIRIRFFMLSGDKGRINDADNPLSHTEDITGVYLTVDAPSTVRITSDFTEAAPTAFDGKKMDSGTTDQLGAVSRVASFPLPSTKGNGPEDISYTGKAEKCWNLFTYKRTSDTYAFPINTVDIVFYGVKPGERVGWTNYQTLHDGYTPKAYSSTSGIDAPARDVTDTTADYYTLQGIKVSRPSKGVYLMRRGSDVRKIVLK